VQAKRRRAKEPQVKGITTPHKAGGIRNKWGERKWMGKKEGRGEQT
jgi:hypothetical protein